MVLFFICQRNARSPPILLGGVHTIQVFSILLKKGFFMAIFKGIIIAFLAGLVSGWILSRKNSLETELGKSFKELLSLAQEKSE